MSDMLRMQQALRNIAHKLASYHTESHCPTKDELWALYSCAIRGLGVKAITPPAEEDTGT